MDETQGDIATAIARVSTKQGLLNIDPTLDWVEVIHGNQTRYT